ncbi:glycosyltransferase [Dactylosporangium sp. CA-139066]|uniref:glycosyltransferase n=1 Tax=Dactylosporangium sp. CA-139066 TaxID=3239930 RepID=UPI003D8E8641
MRFLMVTHGSAGDLLPFLRIGRELAGRGHEIMVLADGSCGAVIERAGLSFVPTSDASPATAYSSAPDLLGAARPAQLREVYLRHGLFEQVRREAEALVRLHRHDETVLVGRHTSAASVLFAAEVLGSTACWVAVSPAQLQVVPLAVGHVETALAEGFNAVRARVGLLPVSDWRAWFGSPDGVLGLWPRWFDVAGTRAPAGVDLAGFVLGDDLSPPGGEARPEDTVAVTLPDPSAVLVTGGTGRMLNPAFYSSAIDAVAAAGRPAIVVTPHRDLLARRLPGCVTWLPEAPFALMLPHVAAIVHHGGIGTAVRALRCGTPQVILADGADRPDNARRLAARGLASWLDPARWSPADIGAALTERLSSRDRSRSSPAPELELESGPRRAAEALEALPPTAGPAQRLRRQLALLSPEQRRRLGRRLPAAGSGEAGR